MKSLVNICLVLITFLLIIQPEVYSQKKEDITHSRKPAFTITSLNDDKIVLQSAIFDDTIAIRYQIPDSIRKNYTHVFINKNIAGILKTDLSTTSINIFLGKETVNLNPENKPFTDVTIGIGNKDSALIRQPLKLIYKQFTLMTLANKETEKALVKEKLKIRFEKPGNYSDQKVYINNLPIGKLNSYSDEPETYWFILENFIYKNDSLAKVLNPENKADIKVNIGIGTDLSHIKTICKNFTIVFDAEKNMRKIFSGIVIFLLIILTVFILFRDRFKILRDTMTNIELPPFSLSRSQMAFWTLIILFAFFIVWFNTGSLIRITPQVLVLLGISAGTTLGASLIDKDDKSNPDITKRHQEQNSTKSFFLNILSDESGLSIHRFQNVIFTLAIGGYFIYEVVHHNTIPELDTNLIVLMGISSGTYLAIKKGENKPEAPKVP